MQEICISISFCLTVLLLDGSEYSLDMFLQRKNDQSGLQKKKTHPSPREKAIYALREIGWVVIII
jgi:hypothetical protein